ncbi:MAG TPA: sigma factor-like helix-turn-helix DNA-binding protein [Streptomyces sp.]|uniref:sigma factor-like helix-turn-helix DNA-binding protein n=1 Tax=Streptomyces sp. TaxID=1931 RepID=UPI002D6E5F7D|nr:sigma factor-like helix-turn-helix DNA-binding protein [Streptomyces sp.]HZG02024.1 sigma factor-like helix-turn-helix DNA-binding protein [Streptomyces sp.]
MTRTIPIPAPGRGPDGPGSVPPPGPTALSGAATVPDPATADGPAEAFDLLYARHAEPLLRQAFVLTGDRRLAERSVAHAFRLAWERWPEVAVDRDPAGWVRAAAHEHALSPWHRLLPRRTAGDGRAPGGDGAPDAPDAPGSGRALLLEALLSLPPAYRRTLLLHDGLGLDLAETAAESEASTPAAAGRLMHAREALAQYAPGLSRVAPERRRRIIRALLEDLAAALPRPEIPSAPEVRGGSERLARFRTGAAVGLTAVVAAASVLTAVTGPEGYAPHRKAPAVSVHSPDQGRADG